MAKTYLTSVKYLIKIKFDIDGVVEKEDIIGAVFGQSEGLLGEDMDLKELQQSGKIGRIEANYKSEFGKTYGELIIPSSMNLPETSLLAAAVESVEKVGPCDSKFEVLEIIDIREEKRQQIKERAKSLLEKFKKDQSVNVNEIADEIKESARELLLSSYGKDNLTCGPDIEKSEEIIVVEGRADVINLLRNNIKNVIEMGGSKISQDVIELTKQKETTLFVDGDRGGELNAKKFMQLASVDYLAKAPEGKEVEELTRKEILQSLKKKVFVGDLNQNKKPTFDKHNEHKKIIKTFSRHRNPRFKDNLPQGRRLIHRRAEEYCTAKESNIKSEEEFDKNEIETFRKIMASVKGKMKAKILNRNLEEILSTDVRNIIDSLNKTNEAYAIVFDGIITKRLLDLAKQKNIAYIVGIKKANFDKPEGIKIIVLD
ncbi:MAG: DNA primase DnaG [Candidatus Diapherotrites archaeon]|nr:DNA primase DnaG [Candidatus Diapherotrites archaeon]